LVGPPLNARALFQSEKVEQILKPVDMVLNVMDESASDTQMLTLDWAKANLPGLYLENNGKRLPRGVLEENGFEDLHDVCVNQEEMQ